MARFSGKVAVVTGAASGIGRALCEALCAEGAIVYAADIQRGGLDELVQSAAGAGEIRGVTLDVTSQNDFARVVRNVVEEQGRLDLIVNNAVIRVVGDFRQMELDDIRRSTDVNLWGVVYGCQAAIPKMKAQGRGYILNVASAAGLLAPPAMSAYNVTKAGVVSLSESLYAEYKSQGIRVSVLCLTFFKTNIVGSGRGATTEKDDAQILRWMERSKVQATLRLVEGTSHLFPDRARDAAAAVRAAAEGLLATL